MLRNNNKTDYDEYGYSGTTSSLIITTTEPPKRHDRLKKTAKYTALSIIAFVVMACVSLYFVADIPRIYIASKQRVASERERALAEHDSFLCRIISNRVDELIDTHQMDVATVNTIRGQFTHEIIDRSRIPCQMAELITKEWPFVQLCKDLIVSLTSGPVTILWTWANNTFWMLLPYATPMGTVFYFVKYGFDVLFKDRVVQMGPFGV